MKLPRASSSAWRRLPGWQRASIAFSLMQSIQSAADRLIGADLSLRKRYRLARLVQKERALLALLLAVDPTLERHLARYERRAIRGSSR